MDSLTSYCFDLSAHIDLIENMETNKEHCQVCGLRHPKSQPHDPSTSKYQTFFKASHPQSESPSWEDAMAHCDENVKTRYRNLLWSKGIDPSSSDVRGERDNYSGRT